MNQKQFYDFWHKKIRCFISSLPYMYGSKRGDVQTGDDLYELIEFYLENKFNLNTWNPNHELCAKYESPELAAEIKKKHKELVHGAIQACNEMRNKIILGEAYGEDYDFKFKKNN